MRRPHFASAAALLVSSFWASFTWSESSLETNRKAFEAAVLAELEGQSPEAAKLFEQANAARAKNDHAVASALYAQAASLVPASPHPLRRQAMEELSLGKRPEALRLARQALALEESPENMDALASALASPEGETKPSPSDLNEARELALRAFESDPDDFYPAATLCQVATAANDLELLRRGALRMVELGPDEPGSHFMTAVVAASDGSITQALTSLARARELGLPEAIYEDFTASLKNSRPWWQRVLRPTAWTLAAWALALASLFVAGALLSRVTLAKAQRISSRTTGAMAGFELALRRAYRAVLWVCCLSYWVSLPLVALLVVAVFGGVALLMFEIGRIPVKLLVIVALLGGTTLLAMLRSLWVRGSDTDPGVKLDLAAHAPGLGGVLSEVAAVIGTRRVDNVYLTPGTDLAVMERGSFWKQTLGRTERCLILGLGVLDGMKLRPFRAILAHEYGHFSNRDTAGGGLALAVRRSLLTMAQRLAEGGAAAWYNPAWLFVSGFYKLFLRISQGASRLQEILADRWAALGYGSKAFEAGLLHVIRRDLEFHTHVQNTLSELEAREQPLTNLYGYQPEVNPDADELAAAVQLAV